MEIADTLPKYISYFNEKGQIMEQLIDYEWLPTKCTNCKKLGHSVTSCKYVSEEVWRQKELKHKEEKPGSSNAGKPEAEKPVHSNEEKPEAEKLVILNAPSSVHQLNSTQLAVVQPYTDPVEVHWVSLKTTRVKRQGVQPSVKQIMNQFSVLQEHQKPVSTFPTTPDPRTLWHDLSHLQWPIKAWIILGDFNTIFAPNDRTGGIPITVKEMEDARQWLYLGLVDEMKIMGSFYTWETVLANWSKQLLYNGRGLEQISWKLTRLKHVLKAFNWKVMGDVACNYERSKRLYQQAHSNCFVDPSNSRLCNENREAFLDFKRQERLYASFLYQKSKIDWLRFGDDNSSFFHASLKKRKLANRIVSYITDDGHHFKSFLGVASKATGNIDVQAIGYGSVLSSEAQLSLIKPFTVLEVKATTFSIHSLKSPSPDGYGAGFFQALWKDIGKEIALAVLEFFDSACIPQTLNKTLISLIPKVDQPVNATDFRPIACCNTIYKCISKMLCNRLKSVLPSLINQNHGAFIKHRSLAHNVLILQDLLKGYNRKNISPRCLLKIDISKAYDSIDWDFLEKLLHALCFLMRFIRWVMVCLRGSSYSLVMNGSIHGHFQGAKGLRQGDPISPLLFVMVMDYLTRLLLKASMEKGFRFHPLFKSLKLVSLCFADDLLLFCKATPRSVMILQQAFNDFTMSSGLSINQSKSRMYIGGLVAGDKVSLLLCSNFIEGQFPLKYLGVPLRPTKWRATDCDIILKKMRIRLNGWASHHLFYVRRVQLVHSVLLGIRSYWMNIFLLPQCVIRDIDCLCRKFLWGEKDNRSKLHLISWEHVCRPKCFGGLGFREGSSWNKIMLAKFIWAVSSKQEILWVKWVNCVSLKGASIWDYLLKQDTSWYWRKIIKFCRVLSSADLEAAIMNGKLQLGKLAIWCTMRRQFGVGSRFLSTNLSFGLLKVLQAVQGWLRGASWPAQYAAWIQWLSLPRTGWCSLVANAACAAIVYLIWLNRNHCWVEKSCLPVSKIDNLIRFSVKARVQNLLDRQCTIRERQMIKFVSNL
ncbi:uncharacterized protein LOC133830168 [Humulus lupulus]|uniref:uncharacterized protein LOC133830168 n=1 Tax=Humulus lupulus TaxID=3486 RepID=UPI002B403366|nr:uncharacterized protein LOC133830168 [Humulus lupulus]